MLQSVTRASGRPASARYGTTLRYDASVQRNASVGWLGASHIGASIPFALVHAELASVLGSILLVTVAKHFFIDILWAMQPLALISYMGLQFPEPVGGNVSALPEFYRSVLQRTHELRVVCTGMLHKRKAAVHYLSTNTVQRAIR